MKTTLLVLSGSGLLLAWIPDQTPWRVFQLLILSLLVLWMLRWIRTPGRAGWTSLFLPFLAIVAWGALQLALDWTVYGFATWTELLRWAVYGALFFLAFQSFSAENDGRFFRHVLVAFSLALAVVSIFQYFLGNGRIFWIFDPPEPAGLGPFLNRDHFASFAALALPAALVEMLRNPRQRWFFALAAAILYAVVIAGASRAGFVLMTFEVVLLFLCLGFSGRVVLATLLLMVVLGFVVGWDSLYERLQMPDPYAGRREVAQATVHMVRANPWKGTGLGTWTLVYPAWALKDFGVFINAAHNDWLQWAADGGIPMAAFLFALFLGSIGIVRKVPWALGIPMVFLHGLVDFPMQGHFLPAAVFVVLGVAARAARHH